MPAGSCPRSAPASSFDLITGLDAAASELDEELIDKIKKLGVHPWMIFRNERNRSQPRFLVCHTQNDVPAFTKSFCASPAFADSRLLSGILRAIQLDIAEASERLFAWSIEAHKDVVEQIYIGLPDSADLPIYYNYPIFAVRQRKRFRRDPALDAAVSLRQLLTLLEAYEKSDGNDRSRLALIEALALAASHHLGRHARFDQAAEVIARGFHIHPHSRRLRVAVNTLDEMSRGSLK